MPGKRQVLFICTHNKARSQMAEALLREMGGEGYEAFSAGSEPAAEVDPRAVVVMAEIGLDISQQRPKLLDEFLDQPLDMVITVCHSALQACPVFPAETAQMHWEIPDPSEAAGSLEEQLEFFRSVRDELRRRVEMWLEIDQHQPNQSCG